jgi:hypothetical protein
MEQMTEARYLEFCKELPILRIGDVCAELTVPGESGDSVRSYFLAVRNSYLEAKKKGKL